MQTPTPDNVLYRMEGAVAVLTLNRPATLNALTHALMADLLAAIERAVHAPHVRALVLTGSGRGFCSGQDLRDRVPNHMDLEEALMQAYYPPMKALRTCPIPVVVAVNGVAAGAGFSLAMAGDFLLASTEAHFIQAFRRIGLVPDLGSTYLLPRAIGRSRALRLMMTGEALSGTQACEWGLAIECVAPEALQARAVEFAQQLAHGPTEALVATRALVDAAQDRDFLTQFREELIVQNRMRNSADAIEGVQAFLEKRPVAFTPRKLPPCA
jgi:2-(1,2-epoxy-1,2-dihydrophenyl)acetyl-CoA isomerase